ncbi:hypothetical protein L486_05572 [Kwoniella mangroviensis CBS 10435]|uniref:N-acetylglucosaminylphosphatidylinositol deacetylase n=1 Tax=Kwoniella mangroviensis CBS 10435 TaxID=1331196 RepID=A0A1B9IM89_9TREE|nr:hypothetical protein L486_05572 [Kwoniella mangroviensis CBS 10435]OCF75291.1 hypothetical protein I204_04144 [Kwoniella mangroviensis CBS 8886]
MPPISPSSKRSGHSEQRTRPYIPLPILLLTSLIPLLALLFPYFSTQPTARFSTYIPSNRGDHPTALILTAHPDDEVMFFSPTILSLVSEGWTVSGLCLSTGNSSGLGNIRTEELYGSYEVLGVLRENVKVIDHPKFQDSMTSHWDASLISDILLDHLKDHPADLIITFDEIGITHHPNHISLPQALALLQTHTRPSPKITHLKSPGVVPKFTGPVYPMYLNLQTILFHIFKSDGQKEGQGEKGLVVVSSPAQWVQSIQAMMAHRTQLVWFRWLYLAASRLMWVNELIEV